MSPEEITRIKAGAANAYDFGGTKPTSPTGANAAGVVGSWNTQTDPSKPNYGIVQFTPSSPISSSTTSPTPQVDYTPKPDTTDYFSGIMGGNATIADNAKAFQEMAKQSAAGQGDSSVTGWLMQQMNQPAPSNAGAYDIVTGTTEEGRNQAQVEAQAASNRAKSAVRAAQAEVAGYQAQLESIVAEKDKTNLQLENQANQNITSAGGAGAIMNTGFLSTQQNKVTREAAIKALPVQGLALAAQAKLMVLQGLAADAQDTLKAAQDKFDKAFELKIADNDRAYKQRQDNLKLAFNYFTDKEKTQAADTKARLATNNTNVNAAINDARVTAGSYSATNPQTSAAIIAIPAPNAFGTDAEVAASIQKYNEAVAMEVGKVVAKPISSGATGSLEEFQSIYKRNPINVAELNVFTASRKSAETVASGNYIPGTNPTVDNWARLIISGQAKITEVPNPRGSNLRSQVVDAITNSGQILLSDKDREKLSTLDTAFNVANTIKDLSAKINTFDVVGRVSRYLSRYLGGATQYNVDIARYNSAREGFVSNVARTLGEKGTLAEGDVRRAIENLPTINDTKDVAKAKLDTLFSILEGTKTSIIQKSTKATTDLTEGTLGGTSGGGGGTATTVKIGTQDVQVGAIIENASGQRAKVNADGTVTPI